MSWRVYTNRQGKTVEELAVKEVTINKYVIHNKNSVYIVDVVYTGKAGWFSCECESFNYRKTNCKHIEAVKLYIEDKEIDERIKNVARESTEELMAG